MTKHLLKLNEIENQFRELTNRFEEVNFKLDKLSSRVTKIQSDTQLRFSDLENETTGKIKAKDNQATLPGSSKPQDFGATPGYQLLIFQRSNQLLLLKARKLLSRKSLRKEKLYCQTSHLRNNTSSHQFYENWRLRNS